MSALRLGGSQMAQILVKLSVCLNGLSTFSFIAELHVLSGSADAPECNCREEHHLM